MGCDLGFDALQRWSGDADQGSTFLDGARPCDQSFDIAVLQGTAGAVRLGSAAAEVAVGDVGTGRRGLFDVNNVGKEPEVRGQIEECIDEG